MVPDINALAIACFVLLGLGYGLLGLLGYLPATARKARALWPALFTTSINVVLGVGALWIGGWVLGLALLALTLRCSYEAAHVALLRVPDADRPMSAMGIGLLTTSGVFLIWLFGVPMAVISLAALAALLATIAGIRQGGHPLGSPRSVVLDLLLFPLLPLIVFASAGMQGDFNAWILVACLLVEIFDSFALLGGKLFGRTKAFPVLSPNKTVEGLAIGLAMLMLTAAMLGALLSGLPVLQSGALALFVGVLTLAGDLLASRLKRRSGVKDYPVVMAHQGGLLDITDAWIVAGAGLVAFLTLTGLG